MNTLKGTGHFGIIALMFTATCVACDSAPEVEATEPVCRVTADTDLWLPLREGNWWKWEIVQHGSVVDTLLETVEGRFHDPRVVNEAFVLHRSASSRGGSAGTRWIWSSEEDGIRQHGVIRSADTTLADFLHLPFPAAEGASAYSYTISVNRLTGVQMVVDSSLHQLVELDTLIVTPKGAYRTDVWRAESQIQPDELADQRYSHFAPGVGLVLRNEWKVRLPTIDPPREQLRLIDYCVLAD